MKRNIKKIWTKYDNLALLPEDLQKVRMQECVAELKNLPEVEKDDEYFYFRGFIHYMSNPSEIAQAQDYLQKALNINPIHNHARMYLGHCLYDTGFYKEAEYHFSLIDKDDFNDWIKMKIEEMLVCCHVKTTGLDEASLLEAKKLISKYQKLDYFDDYLFNLSKVLKEFDIDLDELAIKDLQFRQATREDLPEIVRMLADDFLGTAREQYENPLPESYLKAFMEIEGDKNNELIVAELDGAVVGSLQITFTPSISFQGGKRAGVESVRVDAQFRGRGIGKELMLWAINRAREEKCVAIQLTTNADRTDAHRFYENLGFKGTHLGMKLYL
ncbi:MAG: GNAT family N-acetyltransferase [Actinomycetota bacterium]